MRIFGICPKDDREFVTFKTGKPGGPVVKPQRLLQLLLTVLQDSAIQRPYVSL